MSSKTLRVSTALFAAVVTMMWATSGIAFAQRGGNRPGNNGTIKVDNIPFDAHPNNEPHVSCVFQIDFYNYDKGDLDATYTFKLHPPTAGGSTGGSVFIGEDPPEGGTDLDASVTVDLTNFLNNSGVDPHPIQGYHVKLTIHAEGSQGADVKHKVFWVGPCRQDGSPEAARTAGGQMVKGESNEKAEGENLAAQSDFPFTGREVVIFAGALAMMLGAYLLFVRRLRVRKVKR